MTIHELGDKNKAKLMLLPGTFCDWYGNFASVIELLQDDFHLLIVSYSGFERGDNLIFKSILDEVEQIENYILNNCKGEIDAIYGSSLGGSLVAHIVKRNKIKCKYAILGSSDLDQSTRMMSIVKTKLVVGTAYPIIISGKIESKPAKFFLKKATEEDIKKLIEVLGGKREWVSKKSCINQFQSDLTTRLPRKIDNPNTTIHIFYAAKMGNKYLARYKKHFAKPIIHKQNYAHEELLVFRPKEWVEDVKKIMLA